jgi:hypothetical protein
MEFTIFKIENAPESNLLIFAKTETDGETETKFILSWGDDAKAVLQHLPKI